MISQKMKMKIEFLEQFYFSLDEPVPFKEGLKIYPVLVKDYYKFYSIISCFTFDKNKTMEGISMSNLAYAFKLMADPETGERFTSNFITLLELVFHIKNGWYCDKEHDENNNLKIFYYEDIIKKIEDLPKDISIEDKNIYLRSLLRCPKCGELMREVFSIKEQNNRKTLSIYDIEITPEDFDELKEIVCYQNMPDYEDEYIDPKLKADLEAKAKIENPNAVSPTLEKQMSCIVSSSSYTYEMLHNITIRKLVLLLRTIDAKAHYFCYKQGEVSGKIAMPLYIVKCIEKFVKMPGVPKVILTKAERIKRKCKSYENRKNKMNGIWLNPKCYLKWIIGNQVSIEKGSTTRFLNRKFK